MRSHDPLCAHCRDIDQVREWEELDHIIPLHKGGTDDLDNLQGLCVDHHAAKTRADMGHKASGACDVMGHPIDPRHYWNKVL